MPSRRESSDQQKHPAGILRFPRPAVILSVSEESSFRPLLVLKAYLRRLEVRIPARWREASRIAAPAAAKQAISR